MQSFFGWLDYNTDDSQQMREIFDAFKESDTVDSLGVGTIRDAIADVLFPGISTIQTRARYFLFLPWICQIMEEERTAQQSFSNRHRELEVALIDALKASEPPRSGIIGENARERLARLPLSVYWNGLGQWGIRKSEHSIAEFATLIGNGRSNRPRLRIRGESDSGGVWSPIWDPGLPMAPDGFPFRDISFQLASEESEYLIERIQWSHPNSQLAELVTHLDVSRDVDMPWEWNRNNVPHNEFVATSLVHARNFSDLMFGAQILYNQLLLKHAEKQALAPENGDDLNDYLDELLEEWSDVITARRSGLKDWLDSGKLWAFLDGKTKVHPRTRDFVTNWSNIALAGTVSHQDQLIADLITNRERQLKGSLARLPERRALETWTGSLLNINPMAYRWQNVKRIIDDIHEGSTA